MIKRYVAILLVACYSLALIRPIMPVVGDVLAHTFWRAQHMATVHFENGKYHVHYALQAAAKDEGKRPYSVKADENLDFHIISANETELSTCESKVHVLPYNTVPLLSEFINIDAPPPEV